MEFGRCFFQALQSPSNSGGCGAVVGADHAFHAQAISRTQYGQHAVTVGRHERVQVIHHSEDATST